MIAGTARELGVLLREARQSKGLSQLDLAAKIGVSRQWVIGAEQGAPTAQIELLLTALRLVDLLVDVVPDVDPVTGEGS